MLRAPPADVEVLGLMIALLLAALLVMPAWPYSARWGLFPAGVCGIVALALATLVVFGRL
jgi:uncharacterized protein DUF3309